MAALRFLRKENQAEASTPAERAAAAVKVLERAFKEEEVELAEAISEVVAARELLSEDDSPRHIQQVKEASGDVAKMKTRHEKKRAALGELQAFIRSVDRKGGAAPARSFPEGA